MLNVIDYKLRLYNKAISKAYNTLWIYSPPSIERVTGYHQVTLRSRRSERFLGDRFLPQIKGREETEREREHAHSERSARKQTFWAFFRR